MARFDEAAGEAQARCPGDTLEVIAIAGLGKARSETGEIALHAAVIIVGEGTIGAEPGEPGGRGGTVEKDGAGANGAAEGP